MNRPFASLWVNLQGTIGFAQVLASLNKNTFPLAFQFLLAKFVTLDFDFKPLTQSHEAAQNFLSETLPPVVFVFLIEILNQTST